jgi:hypothetical protein
VNLGLWCWACQDGADARAQARIALDVGESLVDNFCRRESRLLLGAVALADGDLGSAEGYARDARHIAGEGRQALAVGRAERLLGQIAAAGDAVEAASAHYDESERIFRRSGARIELGQTLLARAASAPGSATARDSLLEARRLFRRARARPLLKQAEALLVAPSELSPN